MNIARLLRIFDWKNSKIIFFFAYALYSAIKILKKIWQVPSQLGRIIHTIMYNLDKSLCSSNLVFFYKNSSYNIFIKKITYISVFLVLISSILLFINWQPTNVVSTIFLAISSGFFVNYLYNIKKISIENANKDEIVLNSMKIFYEMKKLADEILKEGKFNEEIVINVYKLSKQISSIVPIIAFLKPEILHSFQLAQLQINELEISAAKKQIPANINNLSQLDAMYRNQEYELATHEAIFSPLKKCGHDVSYYEKPHFFEDGIELQQAYIKLIDRLQFSEEAVKLDLEHPQSEEDLSAKK